MTRKLATVFGGSGFIGRYVVKRLAAQGYHVRVAVRDMHSAKLLTQLGGIGQIIPLFAPLSEEALVARATAGADVVINLTGILAERRKGDFYRVHADGAGRIARLAASSVAAKFIHVSAIGADDTSASDYARSKAQGEAAVFAVFPHATILRPSIVFGAEDSFFNRFAAMASISPVLPVVSGKTKFQPVYVGDVSAAVQSVLMSVDAPGRIYELAGPDIKSFKQLIEIMLKIIDRRCFIWDMPLSLARAQAACLERLPGKLLTRDQIKLLQCDNIMAQGSFGLASLGIIGMPMDLVLHSYLDRYRPSSRRRQALTDN